MRRAATFNPANRFEPRSIVPVDPADPASTEPLWDPLEPSTATTVRIDATRTILTRNDSPDVPFDVSINPYRGCEHGCIYCFARPTHAYLGLSPGIDFETTILAKPTAASLLRRELARPGYRCEPIAIGTNTDPYQPVERSRRITRSILEVLAEHRHPVSIVTKSALVLRDLDLLGPMAALGLAKVFVSVTTLDPELAREMEPRAAAPSRRIETLRALGEAGVPAGVLVSPVVPGLNDHEIERILEAASTAGVRSAGWLLVRLPHEVRELFEEWVRRRYPTRADRVLGRIRAMRDGKLSDPRFGSRMRGSGPFAELLRQRFEIACRRLEVSTRSEPLATGLFRVPGAPGRLFE